MDKESDKISLHFSIWDLILLTAFVAVLFALPSESLKVIAASCLFIAMLLGFLMPTIIPKNMRKGDINRMLYRTVARTFVFSVVTLMIATAALFLKQ